MESISRELCNLEVSLSFLDLILTSQLQCLTEYPRLAASLSFILTFNNYQ